MQLRSLSKQLPDFLPRKHQRRGRQAAQFNPRVFLDHATERQHEQARRIRTGKPAPTGYLHVTDERTERQHQMMLQIHPAGRPGRTSRRADDQAQHAVAPAAHQLLIAFGEQEIDFVDARRIEFEQIGQPVLFAGLHEGQARATGDLGLHRCLPQLLDEPRMQGRPPAAVVAVQQIVLKIDREKLRRAVQLVAVRATQRELVAATAGPQRALLPTGEIEEAWLP
ncbi:hypothetical protein D3C71_1302840 [compost metagenome]